MRRSIAIVLLLVLGLTAAACGGDDPGPANPSPSGESTETTDAPPDDPTDEPTAECDDQTGGDGSIVFQDNFFEPACLSVDHAGALNLSNAGAAAHTFTINDSPVDVTLQPGDEQTLEGPSPVEPGEYTFYCKFHGSAAGGGMAGVITIV